MNAGWIWVGMMGLNLEELCFSEFSITPELLFLDSASQGIAGRTLKLSQTEYANTINANGLAKFVLWLSPQANNNATAFNVVASFSGDSVSTATASMILLNGTSYPVCTTTQYYSGSAAGYKPSTNSTSITVMPQTTTGATTLVNTASVQQTPEIEDHLSVWPEFSLSYPWFRMHVKVEANVGGLDLWFHVGMSPLLPDQGVIEWSPDLVALFESLQGEVLTEIFAELGGLAAMYVAAKVASLPAPEIAALIMAAKFGIQLALLYRDWNDRVGMLASAIVNLLLALLATFRIDIIFMFIANVGVGMTLSALNALKVIGYNIEGFCGTIGGIVKSLPSWVTIMEVTLDIISFELSQWRFFNLR